MYPALLRQIIFIVVLLVDHNSALYCFQCIALDCTDNDPDCENIYSFIKSELGNLYYTDQFVKCPTGEHAPFDWTLMKLNNEPCPESKSNEATCTSGRIQFQSRSSIGNSTKRVVHHASVLGCAKRQLLSNIRTAFAERKCDVDVRERPESNGVSHSLKIEHCRTNSSECYYGDYCVHQSNSEIKVWGQAADENEDKLGFVTILGILGAILIVICAILFLGFWLNQSKNTFKFPKLSKQRRNEGDADALEGLRYRSTPEAEKKNESDSVVQVDMDSPSPLSEKTPTSSTNNAA